MTNDEPTNFYIAARQHELWYFDARPERYPDTRTHAQRRHDRRAELKRLKMERKERARLDAECANEPAFDGIPF